MDGIISYFAFTSVEKLAGRCKNWRNHLNNSQYLANNYEKLRSMHFYFPPAFGPLTLLISRLMYHHHRHFFFQYVRSIAIVTINAPHRIAFIDPFRSLASSSASSDNPLLNATIKRASANIFPSNYEPSPPCSYSFFSFPSSNRAISFEGQKLARLTMWCGSYKLYRDITVGRIEGGKRQREKQGVSKNFWGFGGDGRAMNVEAEPMHLHQYFTLFYLSIC